MSCNHPMHDDDCQDDCDGPCTCGDYDNCDECLNDLPRRVAARRALGTPLKGEAKP
jgi:hypothetical protein